MLASQFHVYLIWVNVRLAWCLKCESACNYEKALVGGFSVILKTDGSFAALVWTPDSCSGECYKLPADKQTPGEPPLELSTISTSHYSYHSDSEAAGGKAGLCRRMFYLVCKSSEAPLIKSLFIPKTCTYSTILSET